MAGQWEHVGNARGGDGVGVPIGGQQGDVLIKQGTSDHATAWGQLRYDQLGGKVPAEALPPIATEPYVVSSEAQMLNLPAVPGRMAIRTDIGRTFILAQEPASVLSNWVEMMASADVQSVNGKIGAVILNKADVGLDQVDNTADVDKPLATGSVRGLMPPAHYTLVNNATANPTANTVARRDASGNASFQRVTGVQAPTAAGHLTRKDYVDNAIAGRNSVGNGAVLNLNTLTTPGVYLAAPTSQNVPILAGWRGNTRVEVETMGSEGAIRQVCSWTGYNTAGTATYAHLTDAERLKLLRFSQVERWALPIEGQPGQYAWSEFQHRGATPWLPILQVPPGSLISGFFGINIRNMHSIGNVDYPFTLANGYWRMRDGMIELNGTLASNGIRTMVDTPLGTVSREIAPLLGTRSANARTLQFRQITAASIRVEPPASSNSSSQLIIQTLHTNGDDSGSGIPYNLAELSWPFAVETYAS